jgi:hypothetical protein
MFRPLYRPSSGCTFSYFKAFFFLFLSTRSRGKALLLEINMCIAVAQFPFHVFVFMDGASTGVYNFQARHPRCVDRITSIDKCSQTQLLIFVLLRGVSTYLVLTTTCFGRYIGHQQVVHSLILKQTIQYRTFFVFVNEISLRLATRRNMSLLRLAM